MKEIIAKAMLLIFIWGALVGVFEWINYLKAQADCNNVFGSREVEYVNYVAYCKKSDTESQKLRNKQ